MSFESDLNIAGSHLLEDEEGLSGELGDDELEQVSGGPLPLVAWGIGLLVGGVMAFGVGEGWMAASNEQRRKPIDVCTAK